MKVTVLFGQRKGQYEGEYGIDAIECISENELEENPGYMHERREKLEAEGDYEGLALIALEVDEAAIRAIMFPGASAIPATVIGQAD